MLLASKKKKLAVTQAICKFAPAASQVACIHSCQACWHPTMLSSLLCTTDAELTVRPDRGAGGGRSDRGGSDRGGGERRPDRRDDRDRDYRSRCVTGAAPAYWSHACLTGQNTGAKATSAALAVCGPVSQRAYFSPPAAACFTVV